MQKGKADLINILYEMVKSITAFFILSTIIINFVANRSFLKYIRIFLGVLLILILIQPILKWRNLDDLLSYYTKSFEWSNQQQYEEKEREFYEAEQEGTNQLLQEYKIELESQMKKIVEKEKANLEQVEIELDTNIESERFGQLKKIVITISAKEETAYSQTDIDQTSRIESIEINPIEIGETQTESNATQYSVTAVSVKEHLAQYYGLDREAVIVYERE